MRRKEYKGGSVERGGAYKLFSFCFSMGINRTKPARIPFLSLTLYFEKCGDFHLARNDAANFPEIKEKESGRRRVMSERNLSIRIMYYKRYSFKIDL